MIIESNEALIKETAVMKTKLQNKTIYGFDDKMGKLTIIGEVTGDFYVVKDFEKWGFSLCLISDEGGVYLILL